MIKEGESIVHFKLRVQDELKNLGFSNPELVEDYKQEVFNFIIFTPPDKWSASIKQRRDIIESIEPDCYKGQTLKESEDEWDNAIALMLGIVFFVSIFGFFIFKVGF